MLSPARATFWTAIIEADWPEDTARAATPPPGVDVAKILEPKKVSGMLCAVELVGGCLVNGHSNSVCGAIAAEAGVEDDSFVVFRIWGHEHISLF